MIKEFLKMVEQLRNDKVPVVGYTWFPAIDMIDWAYRMEPGVADDFLIDLGLWTMQRSEDSKSYPAEIYAQEMQKYSFAALGKDDW